MQQTALHRGWQLRYIDTRPAAESFQATLRIHARAVRRMPAHSFGESRNASSDTRVGRLVPQYRLGAWDGVRVTGLAGLQHEQIIETERRSQIRLRNRGHGVHLTDAC